MAGIRILANKSVAYDSPDHIQPWGTARNNSVNLALNRKLMWWILASQLRVLDLGCAGGGFVKSILDQGGFAVGVEGSDYSKIRMRAEWTTIPEHLFTADITEPFQLLVVDEYGQEHPIQFNVITAWEVMEHINKDKLYDVFANISRHLSPHGVVIMSISPNEEIIQGVKLHQTVARSDWWISKFFEFGFVQHKEVLAYFGSDWVRGEDNAPGSFHLVMTREGEDLPFDNKLRLLTKLVQPWNIAMRISGLVRNKARRTLSHIMPLAIRGIYHRIHDSRCRTLRDSRFL